MELDDPKLLDLMMADLAEAPPLFQPTNYWRRYCQQIVKELRRDGLRDFRRRRGTYMASMGATDPGPTYRAVLDNRRINNMRTQRIPGVLPVLKKLDTLLTDVIGHRLLHATMLYGMTARDVELRAIEKADLAAKKGRAKPLGDLETSLVGSPEYVFRVNGGKPITMALIGYYLRYAYASRFVDFDDLKVLVELGTGAGKQAEVTAKLHPQLAYFCFDLPPQLYIAEQYLKAVFPNRVVSYETCRSMTRAPTPEPGKIYMLGNWQFPLVGELKVDLFWNAASFQEMEPNVVQNYLSTVDKVAQRVFLQENMRGMPKATKSTEAGVIEQTRYEHYERFLPSFRNVHMEPTEYGVTTSDEFSDSFWVRRTNGHGHR
jgi:putative sugar O-methyltransferase